MLSNSFHPKLNFYEIAQLSSIAEGSKNRSRPPLQCQGRLAVHHNCGGLRWGRWGGRGGGGRVAPPWEPRQRARKQDGNGTAVKVGTELSNADHIVQWARLQFGSTAPKSSPRALGLCSGVHTCRSTNLLVCTRSCCQLKSRYPVGTFQCTVWCIHRAE